MNCAWFAVVPVLFEHSQRKASGDAVVTVGQVLGIEPARLKNPATDSEVVLALRVLEGCCLLCPDCAVAAHRYNAVKVILDMLMTRGILEQRACLDTLVALLVGCTDNLMDFKEQEGLNKIADLAKDTDMDDHVEMCRVSASLLWKYKRKLLCSLEVQYARRYEKTLRRRMCILHLLNGPFQLNSGFTIETI
uniref:ubiquitinyl hydrolase 1 n=1 Tax=Arundo donax TaxID=35708 RepID=A0A0A9DH64_ARUDO